MNNHEDLMQVIKERLMMFKNKNSNCSFVLPEYAPKLRIENIFRQTDRTSLFLKQSNTFKNNPYEVALFTIMNNIHGYELFKSSQTQDLLDFYNFVHTLKISIFSNAYTNKSQIKFVSNRIYLDMEEMFKDKNFLSNDIFTIHEDLLKLKFIGDFLAHQIIVNLQLHDYIAYDEKYVKFGPGSIDGIKRLNLEPTYENLSMLLEIASNDTEITQLIPKSIHPDAKQCVLNVETIENALCIFNKIITFKEKNRCNRTYRNENKATSSFIPVKYYE